MEIMVKLVGVTKFPVEIMGKKNPMLKIHGVKIPFVNRIISQRLVMSPFSCCEKLPFFNAQQKDDMFSMPSVRDFGGKPPTKSMDFWRDQKKCFKPQIIQSRLKKKFNLIFRSFLSPSSFFPTKESDNFLHHFH